eukprot:TRINITY_DN8138_c0_g1_i3.p1 TRINITY_DN8138_c0_g1~~TRINITY_DN8138_c0_g1_i3.p1  ORF type:complete len:356 (+),score=107.28 TRINITY_DN8138_c0_g1_i3:132-1199(+)
MCIRDRDGKAGKGAWVNQGAKGGKAGEVQVGARTRGKGGKRGNVVQQESEPTVATRGSSAVVDGYTEEREFGLVDRDKDEQISRAEFKEAYGDEGNPQEFDRVDSNHDNFISKDEFTAAYGAPVPQPAVVATDPHGGKVGKGVGICGDGKKRGKGGKKVKGGERGNVVQQESEPTVATRGSSAVVDASTEEREFGLVDRDKDEQISRAEFKEAYGDEGNPQEFDRVDSNHDNFISKDEFTAAYDAPVPQSEPTPAERANLVVVLENAHSAPVAQPMSAQATARPLAPHADPTPHSLSRRDGVAKIPVPPVQSQDHEHVFAVQELSLIHISEPTRLLSISYAVFCLKKKKKKNNNK